MRRQVQFLARRGHLESLTSGVAAGMADSAIDLDRLCVAPMGLRWRSQNVRSVGHCHLRIRVRNVEGCSTAFRNAGVD